MTYIHHCSTIRNNFTALKLLCALPIHPHPHTPTSWQLLIFLLTPCYYCSVTQLQLTLCDPMDCSTPVFPVLHYLWSLLKLISIESVITSNHLILCHSFLLLPSVFPSIRAFYNKLALRIRWPKYWSFSFSISLWGFPGSSDHKSSAYNAGDLGSIPGLGRSPGEGNGNPLQYSCLENPMD